MRRAMLGALLLLALVAAPVEAVCLRSCAFAATPTADGYLVIYHASGCREWTESPVFWIQRRDATTIGPYFAHLWEDFKRVSRGATWYFQIAPSAAIEDGAILIASHLGQYLASICRPGGDTTPCYAARGPVRQ